MPGKEGVIRLLRESEADILLHYLPVGSEEASRIYFDCAPNVSLALLNNSTAFNASDPAWARRCGDKILPIIGDEKKGTG